MAEVTPEDHFGSAFGCMVACEDGLTECKNGGTPLETCEMSYRDCADGCDRSTLT
jgi:hypothetical protein